ncbi:type II secretion system protein [Zoogloea sp.]|uniref:type II secretion system protein n=1 Tax=Zoogloea sp. TaxID=49181 RepID=UPI0035AEA4F5
MRKQRGFGYVEALVAVILLTVVLVPALEALGNATRNAPKAAQDDALWMSAANKLRDVTGSRFDDLDAAAVAAGGPNTASSLSDPVGGNPRVLIYLSRYDGDNADGDNNGFTGVDTDLIWVRAAIADTPVSLDTLVAR